MHNEAYQFNHITWYVCFIKGLGFMDLDNIDYNVVNNLIPADFLLDHLGEQYQADFLRDMLSRTWKQFLGINFVNKPL